MFIITDLFIGWRTGTLGRGRFLVCALIVAALTVISIWSIWAAINTPYSGNTLIFQWLYWLTLLCSYYSGLLIIIKRFRELVAWPVVWTVIWWVFLLLVQHLPWSRESQYLQMGASLVSLLVFGLLFCAPARRGDLNTEKT